MVLMTLHGIGAMVGELRVEPLVQGRYHLRVGGPVREFCSAVDISVGDGNLAWFSRTKCVQAGHVLAVNMRRTGEVAFAELLLNLSQMRSHKLGLVRIGDVLDHDALDASVGSLGEDVGCILEAEWHDVLASLGDVCLALGVGSEDQYGHRRTDGDGCSQADSRILHERRVQAVVIQLCPAIKIRRSISLSILIDAVGGNREQHAVVYMAQTPGANRPVYRRLIEQLVAQAIGN
jgi:hypothetical protein